MQPASLALSFWTRLAQPGRDRHDYGTFAAVHDLELVPLAHGRLVDMPGENQVGACGHQ